MTMEGEHVFSPRTLCMLDLTENDLTPERAYELCRADFPPEAYQPYKPKGDKGPQLTTLKAHWIIERLNEVFGWDGWLHSWDDIYRHDSEVCATVRLMVMVGKKGRIVHGTGSGTWSFQKGDAIKSAITDGLTKAASYLGMGESMFKGQVDGAAMVAETKKKEKTKTKEKEPMISAAQLAGINETMDWLDDNGGDKWTAESFYDWMGTMSGGKTRPEQLTADQAEHVQKILNAKTEEVTK